MQKLILHTGAAFVIALFTLHEANAQTPATETPAAAAAGPQAPTVLKTTPTLPQAPSVLVESGPVITLEQAHQMAVKNYPMFKNLNEQIYQADVLIQSAWALLLPSLSADAAIIRNADATEIILPTPTGTMSIPIQEEWAQNFGFTANITLFNARSIPLIKNAYSNQDQSRLKAQTAKNDLLFAVTNAYYQINSLRQMVLVTAENLKVANEFLRNAEARKDAGQGTRIDVSRARIQVADTQRTLDNTIDSLHIAKNTLAIFIGIKGEYRVAPSVSQTVPDDSIQSLTEDAMKNRVDLKSAQMDAEMAARMKQETWNKAIPSFDATYKWLWNSTEGFSGENVSWMIIFGARWSILEGGGRLAELKDRGSKIRMANNNIDDLRLKIRQDLDSLYQDVRAKKRNADVSQELVTLAEEAHEMISEQYQVGMATSLDLLDAATELANKRIRLVFDQLSLDIAVLSLRKAAGEYNSLSLN